jgi:hypothetical protein
MTISLNGGRESFGDPDAGATDAQPLFYDFALRRGEEEAKRTVPQRPSGHSHAGKALHFVALQYPHTPCNEMRADATNPRMARKPFRLLD